MGDTLIATEFHAIFEQTRQCVLHRMKNIFHAISPRLRDHIPNM